MEMMGRQVKVAAQDTERHVQVPSQDTTDLYTPHTTDLLQRHGPSCARSSKMVAPIQTNFLAQSCSSI